MAWYDTKTNHSSLLDADEYNNMTSTIVDVSGSHYGHSSNTTIHFPSSALTPWLATSSNLHSISSNLNDKIDNIDTEYSSQVTIGNGLSATEPIYHDGAESTLTVDGYDTISSNASKAYASTQTALYNESDLTSLLNDNYSPSGDLSWASISGLNDVSSTTPTRDYVLKWNGSNWVAALYNQSFAFSINSFSINAGDSAQLIGTGVWKSAGEISFTASYNNGPPDNSCIQLAENDQTYDTLIATMSSPFTSDTNENDINYPSNKDRYYQFRLSSNSSSDTDTDTNNTSDRVTFYNYIYWGIANKNSSFSEADIEGLTGSDITNDHTISKSINCTAGNYIVFAHPASYTDIPTGNDTVGTGFRFNGMTCAFDTKETVSITNSAGYTENYDVYGSTISNLGSSTLYTYTSRQLLNKIYYGVTSKESGFTETDIEGLDESTITNTYDGTIWNEITGTDVEYALFCFPKRWGEKGTDYSFYDHTTGFEASFEDAEVVSITNQNGWSEDFYVYRSENKLNGSITIRTD